MSKLRHYFLRPLPTPLAEESGRLGGARRFLRRPTKRRPRLVLKLTRGMRDLGIETVDCRIAPYAGVGGGLSSCWPERDGNLKKILNIFKLVIRAAKLMIYTGLLRQFGAVDNTEIDQVEY